MPSETGEIVAAVCYRSGPKGLEFLLVRTKGGNHWTFPKGHVEMGEHAFDAAAREAREEAGVEGHVSSTPFTSYRYPSTREGEGESLVDAYLLAVERQREPNHGEHHRNPTWLAPPEATHLLASGRREEKYAEEHARVVGEAVAALSGD